MACVLLGAGFTFFLQIQNISTLSIWLDEQTQVIYASLPIRHSAIEQQPPLYYFVSKTITEIFGFSEASVRLLSVISHALMVVFLILITHLLRTPLACGILIVGFVALNPLLSRYAVEGRPFLFGAMTTVFWVYCLCWEWKSNRHRRFSFRLMAATYLMLLSVGLQPLALSFYVLGVIAVFAGIDKEKKYLHPYFKSLFIALLIFLPTLYLIVSESIPYNQFKGIDGIKKIESISMDHTWIQKNEEFWHYIPGAKWILLLTFFLFLMAWNGKKFRESRHWLILFLSTLALPSIYIWIFYVTINWNFNHRYFLGYVPLFYGVCFLVIFNLIKRIEIRKKIPQLKTVILSLSILALTPVAHKRFTRFHIHEFFNFSSENRPMFHFLNTSIQDPTLVAMYTIHEKMEWEPLAPVGIDFYLSEKNKKLIEIPDDTSNFVRVGDQVLQILRLLKKSNTHQDAIFILGPKLILPEQSYLMKHEFPQVKYVTFKGWDLIHFQKGEKPLDEVIYSYFKAFSESKMPRADSFKVYELLYYLAKKLGHEAEAKTYRTQFFTEMTPDNHFYLHKKKLMEDCESTNCWANEP